MSTSCAILRAIDPRRITVIVGSLRRGSIARKMAHDVLTMSPKDYEANILEIRHLPLYDFDYDEEAPIVHISALKALEGDEKWVQAIVDLMQACDDSKVLGWVSAAQMSSRSVFHGVVEDSIYIRSQAQGRGVAGALLDKLIATCIDLHKWAIHSWIFPENEGSAGPAPASPA